MERERADEVERICFETLIRPPAERAPYLARACDGDDELRREVESLIDADRRAGDFLEKPAVAANRPPFAALGSRVGPYELVRKLGEGGSSTVYLAVRADDQYRKRVALKVVAHGLATAERLRRFRVERQILAGLEHPSIARLLDGGTTDAGLPYFVMELVEGEPIDVYCDRRRLGVDQRIDLLCRVCDAVHYAHRNLIVHRDLKPSNVLVTADGVPKLLDFGIAKLLNPDLALPDPHPTDTWLQAMTPEFASPEQILGAPVTTASDVYALGVMLYLLLTGRLPRRLREPTPAALLRLAGEAIERPSAAVLRPGADGEDPAALADARRTTPKQLARQLRGDLDNVIMGALRAEPDRRYGSAEVLAEELRCYRRGLPVRARRDQLGYRLRKLLRRHRLAFAAAAFAALALALFIAALLHQVSETAAARDRAEETVRFVERMLEIADPARGPGASATVRAALDRGRAQLERLDGQPLLRARLEHFLGVVYVNLGDYEVAEPLLRRALATRRSRLGEHPAVVETENELGLLALSRGRYDEAESIFRRAVELAQRLRPLPRRLLADGREGLGWTLFLRGDLEAAETEHAAALDLRRRLFGDGDQAVAESLSALATVRGESGDHAASIAYYRQALAILEARLGADHPQVAMTLNDLGVELHQAGDDAAAEPVLRRSLAIKRQRLGPGHPMVLNTENSLAAVVLENGDLEAAEALARRVVAGRRQALGEEHPLLAQSRSLLARILTRKGAYDEARALFRQALAQTRRSLGDVHPGVGHVLTGWGELELAAGDPARAEELLREAVRVRAQVLPPAHWHTALSRSLLGAAIAARGDFAAAEALLRDALEVIRAARGDDDRQTREAAARLAELYRRWGRAAGAERYQPAPGDL
ncbi:MAG: serine/threonine protein kinase [Acidobacteria bacterium]|nr:MAG: serine/threonine protein kinase [Acidobacteriota bacterium]